MTSITQKINSINGGISQQPDELKIPGQVVSAKNVFPDVTHGLQKRPGSLLVKSLSNNSDSSLNSQENGKWFSYYRDENEQYIGQVAQDGTVRMWDCLTGTPRTVTDTLPTVTKSNSPYTRNTNNTYSIQCTNHGFNAGEYVRLTFDNNSHTSGTTHLIGFSIVVQIQTITDANNFVAYEGPTNNPWNNLAGTGTVTTIKQKYLTHGDDNNIQDLTLNDFTFINNRTKQTKMAATTEPAQPNQAFIELKQIKYASQYGVDLFNSTDPSTLSTVSTVTRLGIEYNASASPDPNNAVNTDGSSTEYDLDTDGTCDSVGTQLFTVNASDTNSYVVLYRGATSASNTFNNRGTDLIFRITTTGQPTTTGGSEPTYVCRYTVKIDLLHGGSGWEVGDKIRVDLNNGHTQTFYNVVVEEVSTAKVAANLGLVRPTPTPFDGETAITGDMILGKIREGITGNATNTGNGFEVEQIGDGLYITRTAGTFNVNTPVSELLNVLTSEVQDVADLPKQCKDGYIVKVRNSANDEDDYYLKFFANNNLSGDGVWEECNRPGRLIEFDKSTMPVQLIRTSTGQFTLSQINYKDCAVGDQFTSPKPSFISTVAGQDEDIETTNKTINKMVFFRNRLVFLSDENVIMSRPGDFFNFWAKSAIAASAEDPIDLSCSSEYPAIIFDGIEVNSGLVLFTKNQQFMLTTDSDVLSPLTAKINALSTYNFNHQTNPVSLGTTIAFLDNAGKFTRMFEMASVLREGEPVILEQSKVISKLFPKNINLIANSRENSFIVFAEKNQSTVYGFRYFTSGEKRIMQSWVTWELSGNIQYMCMLDDAIYAVVRNGTSTFTLNGVDVMQKFNLKLSGEEGESISHNSKDYRVYLDNIHKISHTTTTLTPNTTTNPTTTSFAMPEGFASNKTLVVYDTDTGDDLGSFKEVTVNGGTIQIEGDWTGQDFLLGYLYDMEVELPKFYVTQQSGDRFVSDVQSNLVVHRVKFNFGPLGAYQTTLQRVGKSDFTETYESIIADQSSSNRLAIQTEQEVTVPVYERNTNYTLTIKSSKPTPATLYSLAWEGDYSNTFYKRV